MEAWPDIFPLKKKNIMQLCKESKYMSFQGDNHQGLKSAVLSAGKIDFLACQATFMLNYPISKVQPSHNLINWKS